MLVERPRLQPHAAAGIAWRLYNSVVLFFMVKQRMDKQDSAARTQHRVREKIHTQDARMQSRKFKKFIVHEYMILFM
jgi:hypothetical protein